MADHKSKRYFVRARASGGQVVGYGVYDTTGGLDAAEVAFYAIDRDRSGQVALHLANTHRDDLNAEIA